MNKYIIPYKEKKDNPRAGRSDYTYPCGPIRYEIQSEEKLEELENNSLIRLSSFNPKAEYPYFYEGYNLESIPHIENGTINRYQNYQTVYSLTPEPSFIYQYDDCDVECESCGEKFSWKELKSEDDEWYDGYSYSDTICPHCGEWDCCKVEFQL